MKITPLLTHLRDHVETIKWLRERYRDELDLSLSTALSGMQFAQLLAYFQPQWEWPQTVAFAAMDQRPIAPE